MWGLKSWADLFLGKQPRNWPEETLEEGEWPDQALPEALSRLPPWRIRLRDGTKAQH